MMDLFGNLSVRLSKGKCKQGKVCTKCKEYKPLWRFSVDNARQDRLRNACKDCDKKQQHDIRKKMQYIEPPEYKQCSDCGRIKPISDFGVDKTKKDKHRSYCKDCMKIRSKRYVVAKTAMRKNKRFSK